MGLTMWPIPSLDHNIVTISFSSDNLVCSWIQKTKTGTAPLRLCAYQRYQLTHLELANLILFNPTTIKKYITFFLQKHNLYDAFIVCSFEGAVIAETFIAMPTATPHRADFGIPISSNTAWEYRYMYPNDHSQHVFYIYTMPRLLVLQYQLLAITMRCNVITMTTKTMALFYAYKTIFGAAFRKSQLAVDMMRHHNNIEDLISLDALRRMISMPLEINVKDEKSFIATAVGLFCAER